ncbi:unnamed protein product [Dovyalis caffra]|uniref:glucan endo-1,3-beta-D-glucosidase n=1 Tax=Dovyalis caffra TaxID=77055 RepID=A0AAV1R6M2_9ROSI|nr:unnamed protein product [Dovyalis caffra]
MNSYYEINLVAPDHKVKALKEVPYNSKRSSTTKKISLQNDRTNTIVQPEDHDFFPMRAKTEALMVVENTGSEVNPTWGRDYRTQAYSLMDDPMNLGRRSTSNYMRLRRNQESTSEAVNAYYSAALMGLAYRDTHLVAACSLLATLEIYIAHIWWQVKNRSGNTLLSKYAFKHQVTDNPCTIMDKQLVKAIVVEEVVLDRVESSIKGVAATVKNERG